ncbi:MAG: hypothetical protein PUD34_02835 [bacterium]|nr:hypothetical protein [bacterium]
MKIKLFFLTIGACILTYLIFTANNRQYLTITSIYDDSTTIKESYNVHLNQSLNMSIPTSYYTFHRENFEIENVVDKIQDNVDNIQEKLDSSNIILVYLGDFEVLYEKNATINIYNELQKLFIILRKYNSKQIIFISPVNMSSSYLLEDLAKKYKIEFFNTPSLLNKRMVSNYQLSEEDHKIIAQKLQNIIMSTWKVEN